MAAHTHDLTRLLALFGRRELHGQAGQRSFDSSWVGLDVLEAVCLLSVAQLMRRQHRATSPAAAATAAILCMDAWFDTMSAAPQLPYVEALAMAWFAELPLAALLVWRNVSTVPILSAVTSTATAGHISTSRYDLPYAMTTCPTP